MLCGHRCEYFTTCSNTAQPIIIKNQKYPFSKSPFTISDFPLPSLISSILFSCDRTLVRSTLGSGVALGPNWVSLTLIPALFPLFLRRSHCLQWRLVRLVQLVWLGDQKMLWAVIISWSAALNPMPILHFSNADECITN